MTNGHWIQCPGLTTWEPNIERVILTVEHGDCTECGGYTVSFGDKPSIQQ